MYLEQKNFCYGMLHSVGMPKWISEYSTLLFVSCRSVVMTATNGTTQSVWDVAMTTSKTPTSNSAAGVDEKVIL